MNSKLKIIYRVGKRGLKSAAKGHLKYHDKGLIKMGFYAVKYMIKFGPVAFLIKVKQELVKIDRRVGNELYFPNGLVSGVDAVKIEEWYETKAKPVTIIIPSYNDLEHLVPCLKSIADTTDPELVKVLVVDDYCQEANSKQLKKLQNDQVAVLFRDQNGGFAKAVNSGLKAANPKHDVILLNSDTEAHEGWLAALQYGAYEFGVDTGIVGPKLLYPDGRIQSAGGHRNTDDPRWFDHYYRFQESNYGPANIPQYCVYTTGACMYIKREFLNYIGVLDDNYEFAFEDVDICLRGWDAGFRTLYFPSAVLTHKEGVTRGKNVEIGKKEKQSIDYFWNKWGPWFDDRNVKDASGKIKVIYVLQTMGWSGGIKIVFEHANRLDKKKFNVEIWALDHHEQVWPAESHVKIRTFKNYERMITSLKDQHAIKVATWWETAFPVWLSSIKNGIAVNFIQEVETWFYPDDIVAQSVVISCYRREFKNMTTAKYNLEEIQALGLKATAIPCGFDDQMYKRLPKVKRQDDVLLGVGRKFFQKNFEFTLKGWQAMGELRPTLQLFGSEPELSKLDPKIKYDVKPTDKEVNELYNKAAVFVQTSRHEGFCLPLLEAMASGTPVVCTDAHGNRDFCVDGKNCLMVEHDNVEQLQAALTKLFKDPALRTKLGAAAQRTTKAYRWGIVIKRVETFYEDIANAK